MSAECPKPNVLAFNYKGTSINCHSKHREESYDAFKLNTEMFRFAQHDIFRTILYLFLPFRPTLHRLSRYGLGFDRVSIGYGLAQGGIDRNQSPNRDQIWTKI